MNAILPRVDGSDAAALMERVIAAGDLSKLTPDQRSQFYLAVCQSIDVNPLTRPFEYLTLNGKMVLYARKDCTDQLRSKRRISVQVVGKEIEAGLIMVTARAIMPDGRQDEDYGAVPLPPNGEARANALMKAMTKAKRRVTLSICGLGLLDESEIESIPAGERYVASYAAAEPAAQPTLAQELAAAKADTLPLLAPSGAVVEVARRSWLAGVERALAQLESAEAVRSWRAAMEDTLEALDDQALAADARAKVAARLEALAGDDFPGDRP